MGEAHARADVPNRARPIDRLSRRHARIAFQSRQPEAGSELVLAQLLGQEGLRKSDLHCVDAVERSEMDLGMAIAAGKATSGLGIEASARQFQLEFTALLVERFDLLIWRKAYFDPPFQKLIRFCASEPFERRAQEFAAMTLEVRARYISNGP